MPSEGNGPIRPSMTRHEQPQRALSRHSYGTETLGSRLTPRLFGPTIGCKTGRHWIWTFSGWDRCPSEKACKSAGKPVTRRTQSEVSPQLRGKKRAARPTPGRFGKSTTLDKGRPPALASLYPSKAVLRRIWRRCGTHDRRLRKSPA